MKIADIQRSIVVEHPIYQDFYAAGCILKEYKLRPKQLSLLIERQLTAPEIDKIFQTVGTEAMAGKNTDTGAADPKSNRTLLGKGADAAAKVAAGWDKVKTSIQKSGPVAGFDQFVDSLQGDILQAAGGEAGVVGKAIQKYRDFARQHPIMQGAIYAGLIALAGISGAGLGGAALLGGIKIFDRLLQGDKASSALWKGFVTGATAYAAGKLMGKDPGYEVGQEGPADIGDQAFPTSDAGTATSSTGAQGAVSGGGTKIPPHAEMDFDKYDYTVGSKNSMVISPKEIPTDTGSGALSDTNPAAIQAARGGTQNYIMIANQPVIPGSALTTDQIGAIQMAHSMGNDVSRMYPKSVIDQFFAQGGKLADVASDAYKQGVLNAPDAGLAGGRGVFEVKQLKSINNAARVESRQYIDKDSTVRTWMLRESLGKQRGGVQITEAGVDHIFKLVVAKLKLLEDRRIEPTLDAPPATPVPPAATPATPAAKQPGIMSKALSGVKGAASKVAGGLGKVAGSIGKAASKGWDSATNKITYDKLKMNWGKSRPNVGKGDPQAMTADSAEVEKFLKDQGVKQGLISQVFKSLNIPTGKSPDYSAGQTTAGPGNAPGGLTPRGAGMPGPQGQAGPIPAPQGQAGPAGSPSPTTDTGEPGLGDKIGNKANKFGQGVAGFIKGAEDAWKAGAQSTGGAWASVAAPPGGFGSKDTGNTPSNLVTIKDRRGVARNYRKVGNDWVDQNNQPITDPATIGMLDAQQSKQGADKSGTTAPAQADAAKPGAPAVPGTTAPAQAGAAKPGTTAVPGTTAPAQAGAAKPGTTPNYGQSFGKQQATPVVKTPQGQNIPTFGKTQQAATAPTGTGNAGADRFAKMVGQLQPPQKSSTGGTTTQTATGVRHTANPNNPNLKQTTTAVPKKVAEPETTTETRLRERRKSIKESYTAKQLLDSYDKFLTKLEK